LARNRHTFSPDKEPGMRLDLIAAWATLLLIVPAQAQTTQAQTARHPIDVVAAENFYGDVARQIGGPEVHVTSILSNPDEDPHLFEASTSVARVLSAARIVVYSGIDYDPWMTKLIRAAQSADRQVIVVADLVGRKTGANPHIWYDPTTMIACAKALAAALDTADPAHKDGYDQRLARFTASIAPIKAKIAALRQRLAGTPVTATEPVFGYMFEALGMQVRNLRFQIAVMNGTEPSAADVAAFETDLRTHAVKLLVYNTQASDPIAQRMERLAKASHVQIVGAAETEPPGKTYQAWITGELAAVAKALPPGP
jgi:zinc/manganese transport system substrate-binding protein